jgi:hypothetical protein
LDLKVFFTLVTPAREYHVVDFDCCFSTASDLFFIWKAIKAPDYMTILCYVSGRIDPTHFFYNMMVVFDEVPDLYSLRRAIEQRSHEDGLCPDGTEYTISDIEVLDFRINAWVNLESRGQLYSGCFLTAIRDVASSTSAGAVDTTSRTSMQRVLGFAVNAQRMFEALDIDGEGLLKLKGFLRVLRHDIEYAVDAMGFLDEDAAGVVTFQQFLQKYHDTANSPFFRTLKNRIENAGRDITDPHADPNADVGPNGSMSTAISTNQQVLDGAATSASPKLPSMGEKVSTVAEVRSNPAEDSDGARAPSPTDSDLPSAPNKYADDLESVADTAHSLSPRGRSRRGAPTSNMRSVFSSAAIPPAAVSKSPSARGSPPLSPSQGGGHALSQETSSSLTASSLRKVSTTLGLASVKGGAGSLRSLGGPKQQ